MYQAMRSCEKDKKTAAAATFDVNKCLERFKLPISLISIVLSLTI